MHIHNVIFNVMALLYLITQRAILRAPLEHNNSVSLCVEFNRGLIMKYSMQCVCVLMGWGTCWMKGLAKTLCSFPPQCQGRAAGGSLAARRRCRSDHSCHRRPQQEMELSRNKKKKVKHFLKNNNNTAFVYQDESKLFSGCLFIAFTLIFAGDDIKNNPA